MIEALRVPVIDFRGKYTLFFQVLVYTLLLRSKLHRHSLSRLAVMLVETLSRSTVGRRNTDQVCFHPAELLLPRRSDLLEISRTLLPHNAPSPKNTRQSRHLGKGTALGTRGRSVQERGQVHRRVQERAEERSRCHVREKIRVRKADSAFRSPSNHVHKAKPKMNEDICLS